MKYFVVIFALCFTGALAGITEGQKAKLSNYKANCVARTGVNPAVLEQIRKGQNVQFDEKVNCFYACFLQEIGILRDNGTIDEVVARSKIPKDLPKDRVDQVFNECKAQVGKNNCETGGKIMACLLKTKLIPVL